MADKKIDFLGFGDPFLDLVVELKKLPDTNTNTQITDYIFQGGEMFRVQRLQRHAWV